MSKKPGREGRRRGALLGMAVGDALGTTFEFKRIEQPSYPALATGPATDVIGQGPFRLAPGQITDDTQLAVCLARSLAERGRLDVADVGRRYVAWLAHAFDVGTQTRAAIQQLEAGSSAEESGLLAWRASNRKGAGNGSLMRTTPIGVAFAGTPDVVASAIADSLITHADPRCALACAAFDAAIGHAVELRDEEVDGQVLVDVAREALVAGAAHLRERWRDSSEISYVDSALAELSTDLDAACAASPGVDCEPLHIHENQGFVRVAFRLAFWHAVHTGSWHDALVDVASRGGDADTNAAIVGGLLGARDGDVAIPTVWIERVLAATQPGPESWADAHHPKHLLALV